MLKNLIKFGAILLMFFLVACGGNNAVEAPEQEHVEESAPESVEDTPANTAVESEAMPVAAKPQFIEFYADW